MEKEELKSHVYYQFKKIAELEQVKGKRTLELQKELFTVFKNHMPGLVETDTEIQERVNEIHLAAKDLKESFSCENGRIIYIPAWGTNEEQFRIEGVYKEGDPEVLNFMKRGADLMKNGGPCSGCPGGSDLDETIKTGIEAFIFRLPLDGGDKD